MPREKEEEEEMEKEEEMEEEVGGGLSVEAQPCRCCLPDFNHAWGRSRSGAFPRCQQPGEIKKPKPQQLRGGGRGGGPVAAACSVPRRALWPSGGLM